jgi:hypothetical protein
MFAAAAISSPRQSPFRMMVAQVGVDVGGVDEVWGVFRMMVVQVGLREARGCGVD